MKKFTISMAIIVADWACCYVAGYAISKAFTALYYKMVK